MKKQTFTFLFLMLAYIGYSQTGTITGVAVDASGSLPGVSILVQGTTRGETTDLDGNFRISNIPTGKQTLILSFIGYKTLKKEITVKQGMNNLGNISLSESDEQLEEVVINSTIRQSQMKALSMQKSAPQIMSVIAADAIGKLPDRNAAEAVQRVGGVAVERDQGEGRYVLVRGTPKQWSSTLVNGDRMPSTSSGDRGVPLDIFPSELIQFVQVSKAITPDMEGDVIGGAVNFITRTSPSKQILSTSLSAGYNNQAKSRIYNGSVIYGDRSKNKKFGYIFTAATWNREWGSDNYELVYNAKKGKPKHSVQQLQLRDYLGNRTTWGFNGAMDYEFNSSNKIYLKGMWTDFQDDEIRYRTRFRFGKAEKDVKKGRVEHALTHTAYHSRFGGIEFGGGNSLSDKIKIDWKLSNYRASLWYDSPVKRNPGLFEGMGPKDSKDRGYYYSTWIQNGVTFDDMVNVGGKNYKFIAKDSPNGVGEKDIENFQPRVNTNTPIDASKAKLSAAIASGRWVNERDITGKLDLTIDASDKVKVKIGAKLRDKDREVTRAVTYWRPASDVFITDVETEAFPTKGGFLTEINEPYNQYLINYPTLAANDALIDRSDMKKAYESPSHHKRATSTYKAGENIFAGYGMLTWNMAEEWMLIAGARYENTSIDYESSQVTSKKVKNKTEYKVTPKNAKRSYGAFLPMLHLKFSPNSNTNFRFAATKTFIRPDFVDLSPSSSFSEDGDEAKFGNPNLKPTFSLNFDVLAERYFSNVGVISGGIFYKNIKDAIFDAVEQGEINGKSYKITTPKNASDAWLLGIEVGVQRRLDFLPGFLSGLGVDVNYTYTDSEVQVPGRAVKQPLFGQSKHIYNASLFYEKYGLSARLAANFKGAYLARLQGSGPDQDRYYDSNLNLDFSTSYSISKKVKVFLEMNNLLNEPLRYYHGDVNRPEQVEWYSFKAQGGVTVDF